MVRSTCINAVCVSLVLFFEGEEGMLKKMLKSEEGLETVEYAIIAGLIVVGVIATVTNIGSWVATQFGALLTALQS